MGIFSRVEPPRATVNADNPCVYEDGLAVSEFFSPSSKYFGRQTVAVQNKRQDGKPTFMVPIAHFHLLQNEEFYVESGRGYWYLQGKKTQLKAGDSITIPRCKSHWFENDPDSSEPLVILYQYDPTHWEMMERFFRNVFTYFDDCRKAGVQPTLMQVCIFCTDAWMPPDVIPCPGGDYVRCAVNTIFMWILALMGYFVFGYNRSYKEYYDPVLSKQRFAKAGKKVA